MSASSSVSLLSGGENALKNSLIQTFMNLIKSMIGTGILSLPIGFKYSGMAIGISTLVVVAFLSTCSIHLLMHCSAHLERTLPEDVREEGGPLSYREIIYYSVMTGLDSPRMARLFAFLVNLFLVSSQLGFCVIYTIFVAENTHQAIGYYKLADVDSLYYYLATTAALMVFVFIKDLRQLAACSLFANIINLMAVAFLFYFCLTETLPLGTLAMSTDFLGFALFFGVAAYSFEGIGLAVVIRNGMRNVADFGGLCGLLNTTMSLVALVEVAIGFFGYSRFGAQICPSVTLNLPPSTLSITIRLLFVCSVFITYGLQFYVPIQIFLPRYLALSRPFFGGRSALAEYCLRFALILLIAIPAIFIPYMDLMISLVGSVCCTSLALILPSVAYVSLYWRDRSNCMWTMVFSIFVAVFGLFGMGVGAFSSVLSIVDALSGRHTSPPHCSANQNL